MYKNLMITFILVSTTAFLAQPETMYLYRGGTKEVPLSVLASLQR